MAIRWAKNVAATSSSAYPEVTDYASLPVATTVSGEIYVVQTTTGVIGFRKLAGLWRSDGASWLYLGLYGRNASEIVNVPTGTVSSTDVQAAITELDGDIQSHIATGGFAHANVTTSTAGFMSAADKVKIDAITGTNTGDQTTVSGNAGSATVLQTSRNFSISGGGITASTVGFTGAANVVLSASVDAGHVTLSRMADIATSSLIYRKTAGTGTPEVNTLATLKTDLGLTGTNSGDQTSIVGITGTLAQFNTAITDADILSTASAASTYQPLDTQLTDLATLAYASNALKVIRVNAAANAWELVTLAGGGDMLAANNLSDLASAATARTNLGLGTLATQNGTFSGTSSGTNTGDQTSIVGITGTLAQFNTAVTDADLARTDAANTFTGVQTFSAAPVFSAGIPNTEIPNGISNSNTAAQSQVTVAGTSYYITNSNLNLPATLKAGMVVGTRFVWRVAMTKTAAGTGTFLIKIFRGVNGTTADTQDVNQSIGTQTAVVDNMVVDVIVVVTATGASGSYYWSIVPVNKAITATGFGVATGTGAMFSGTVSAVAMNTTSLKFGLGFASTTGTPTVVVPFVHAQAFNID